MAANNTADVSNVKGVQGGYGFNAPIGTAAGSSENPFATLSATWDNMGFIGSDGIEESIEADITEATDMNGDVIFVAKSKETEKLVLTLTGITEASLKQWHGAANVDASSADYIAVKHTAAERASEAYCFELLLKDGRRWRKHVPNGKVTDVGPIVHCSGSVCAREITITCSPDSSGVRVYDYIEKEAASTTTTQ